MKQIVLLLVVLCSLPLFVLEIEAKSVSDDPELEKRVMALSEELRCVVCQNETLASSHADLAVDMRQQIREQMKAGKSDKEILAFLTARYGDFVLYRPRVAPITYLLWFGPFALMVIGLGVLFRHLKQRRELVIQKPLSQEEHRRAEELLKVAPKKEPA